MLELGQGLRRAADVAEDWGAFRRAGVGAERFIEKRSDFSCKIFSSSNLNWRSKLRVEYDGDVHLTDAVRERCSLESITQPT